MINGAEFGKIFKTLLICSVLGKYDTSYSPLFCCSYETVETDFPIYEIFISILNLRNSDNKRYQTLHMSFLNYLLIIKAKVWDLCIIIIIIIISFSILIAFRIMPNDWIGWWVQLNPAKCAKLFKISCALGKNHLNYILTFHLWNSAKRNREVAVIWHC